MIKIDKGIPMEKHYKIYGKYPFRQMEVGDSFALGCDEIESCRSAMRWFSKRNPDKKFASRFNGVNFRVWRIK